MSLFRSEVLEEMNTRGEVSADYELRYYQILNGMAFKAMEKANVAVGATAEVWIKYLREADESAQGILEQILRKKLPGETEENS